MPKRVTIREIAKIAGVNISTVSRVLSPTASGRISAEQRQKILDICNQLNYRPRISGRSCVTGKTYKIGLILGAIERDLGHNVFARYIRGLCSELQKNGYALTILRAGESRENLSSEVKEFLLSDIADGYVLGAGLLAEQTVEMLRTLKRPLLALKHNNQWEKEGVMTVETTPENAYRKIWQAMPQELYKDVLCLGGDRAHDRRKGAVLKKFAPENVCVREFYYLWEGDENVHMTYAYPLARMKISENWEKIAQARVVWCVSDAIAYALCDEMQSRGVMPGKDIFVIGYDNMESEYPFPGRTDFLTTIDPLLEQAGQISAAMLLEAVEDPGKTPENRVVQSDYICRKTFPFDLK